MKVLSVEIYNIQSLRGKHIIDFTQEPLKNAGIILVTGDTGAGKTTTFNSILLALYGATKEVAERVVSTDANEAHVFVTFEVNGNLYTAKWFAKRNKKNEFETETWFIDHQDKTKSYTQKNTKEKAREAIQNIIKLSVEQFTRSIMLAQGEFDKFLKSKETEKTEILEKLTQGEIYKQIAEAIYERHRTEEQELKDLQNDLQRFACLSEGELENLAKEQEKLENSNQSIKEKLENLDKQIKLLESTKEIEDEISKLKSKEEEQSKRQTEVQTKKELCEWHKKTSPLHAQWSMLKNLRPKIAEKEKKQKEIQEQLNKLQEQLKVLQNQLQQKQERQKEFLQQQEKIQQIINEQIQPLQQKLQILEVQKQEKQKTLEDTQKKLQQNIAKLPNKWSESQSSEKNLQRIQIGKDKLQEIEQFLEQNHEKDLSAELDQIQKTLPILQNLQEKQRETQTKQQELKNTQTEYEKASSELQKIQKDIQEADVQRIFYQEKIFAEQKIVSLEKYRQELKPNEACPLCGSLHHPFTQNLPATNLSENEKKFKEAEEKLKNLQEKLQKNQSEFLKSKQLYLENQIQELQKTIEQDAQNLTIQDFSIENLTKILEKQENQKKSLEKQIAEIRQKEKEKNLIEHEISALQTEAEILEQNAQMANLEKNIKKNETSIQTFIEKCREYLPEISFGNVDDLVKQLKTQNQQFEENIKEIEKNYRDIENESIRQEAQKKQIISDLEKETYEKNQIESQLQKAIEELGLKSIEELATKILPAEILQKYQKDIEDYERNLNSIQSLLQDKKKKLQEIKQKVSTETDLETLKKDKENLENQQAENQKELGSIQEKLANNQKNQEKYQEIQIKIQEQNERLTNWEKLKKVLAEPKDKFARIAQSITLEHLISKANIHLQKLSERYQLQKLGEDKKKSLDLCVVDIFKANTIREVSTLSGGETFLVSLALALGLSDMASKNVEIRMLFIDEGFGTLDANTLDIAMNVLETLQNEGKTIVIISHLAEIKERIHTKIGIEKTGKGDSKIVIPSANFT